MICPQCHAEYLSHINICGDCKNPLVDASNIDLPITEMKWLPLPIIEGMIMNERVVSYKFMIESALQMCPKIDPSNIKVVFADEFLSQETITSSGLSKAKLFHDHWHLKLNQEKELGLHLYAKCKPKLDRLMAANTEELFMNYVLI